MEFNSALGSAGERRVARRPHGVSLIEMALILPLLVLLTFGLIQYAWMFVNLHEVTNAARETARYASLPGTTTITQINSRADQLMTQYNLNNSGYSTNVTPSDWSSPPTRGTSITVQITVPSGNVALLSGFVPMPANLTAHMTIEREGP